MARRLSGGEWSLIGVVSVLVLTFLVLFVGRIGDAPTADTASPTPTVAAPTTAPTGAVVDLTGVDWTFRLPSGNIGCAIAEDGVTCGIESFEYEPPALAGCDGDTGVAFRLESQGALPLCTIGAVGFAEAPELPYGESASAGEFTCTSSETGVACRNALGHEMTLRRASYGL
ncbi:MAG: DUF6636 domain-containing protein [Actinomycetota bacterium]